MARVQVADVEQEVLSTLARARAPEGLRVRDLARELYHTREPSRAQREAVRKAVRRLQQRELVEVVPPGRERGGWGRWPRVRLAQLTLPVP